MKYLKSLKKSEVGSNEFYSNKSAFFSNSLPYAVLTAIDDDYSNDITIKYQWTDSNSITIYGQSSGSSNDFYLEAISPKCIGVMSNEQTYPFEVSHYQFNSQSDITGGRMEFKKLALHDGINQIDSYYLSTYYYKVEDLYLLYDGVVSMDLSSNTINNGFSNMSLHIPSNKYSSYTSTDQLSVFKSIQTF